MKINDEMKDFISLLTESGMDKMINALLQSDPAIIYFVYFGLESYGAQQLVDMFSAFKLNAD